MYRLMQPSDEAAVLALWQSQHHDTEDFAKMVLERFAGVQNIYVADENDAIVAAALAVPVTLQGRTGNYLCLCGEGAAQPALAEAYARLGVRAFSLPARELLEVKEYLMGVTL